MNGTATRTRLVSIVSIVPIVAVLLTLFACSDGFGQSRVALADDGRPRTPADHDVLRRLDLVLTSLETVRERDFLKPVVAGFYDREQVRGYLREQLLTLVPPETFAAQERVMKAFGLLAPDVDLPALLLDSLTAGIGGFYDWKRVRLYCVSSGLGALNQFVMIHEATHALQDEFSSLEAFALNAEVLEHDDISMARSAIVEGEATYVTTEVIDDFGEDLFDRSDFDAAGVAEVLVQQIVAGTSIPPIIMDGMNFPYVKGEQFVRRVHRLGGWRAVDALYDDPPASTEQIIHPEKYLVEPRDAPLPVVTPDCAVLLGDGWRTLTTNGFGELGTRQLVQFTGDPGDVFRASFGWGGDAYRLYAHASLPDVLQWTWVGDTEEDALELFEALARITAATYDDRFIAADDDSDELRVTDERGVLRELVTREDTVILWLRGLPDGADADGIAARCLP